jgi:DNA (cytosine-5)-methyltransferase 1
METVTSVDLFAGAGGLTLGFQDAGFSCVGAIELDGFAAMTFKRNFPDIPLLRQDISILSDREIGQMFGGVDVIVAGPPCQGFSVAGPSQYGKIDRRNQLLLQIARFAEYVRPAVCVVENVKGLLYGRLTKSSKALHAYANKMEKLGYTVTSQLLQTADFGIPQWRQRLFLFAVKSKRRQFPQVVGQYGSVQCPWRVVREAISDLPLVDNGKGTDALVPYDKAPEYSYQSMLREGSNGVANHTSMHHTPRLVERFKHIQVGRSLVDVPPEHGQRLRNGNSLDVRMRFKMNNQRLDPEKVSLAITASFQSNFVHPFLHRNLTAREGARIQSFPDKFIFEGPRTLMSRTLLLREGRLDEIGLSQYNQIGNAVPPLLAMEVGKVVRRYLTS